MASSRKALIVVVLSLVAISCSLVVAAAESDAHVAHLMAGGAELSMDPFRIEQSRSAGEAALAAGSRLTGGHGNPTSLGGRRSLLQSLVDIESNNVKRRSGSSGYRTVAPPSCNKKPGVCKEEGSKGPACCHGKCVNLQTDKYNCGKCGRVAGKNLACCKGHAVDLKSSSTNCGKCGLRCPFGHKCQYGTCNYAL